MVRNAVLVACDRLAWVILGLIVGALSAATVFSQAAQPPAAPAQQAVAAAPARVFTADAGLVLNFIKADKTKDFEAVIAKLKDALAESAKPERQELAKTWRVFKSPDPAVGGAALYVYVIDPPVKGADYTVTNILAEALSPDELTPLTKQYVDSYASGQNFVNLTLVADLGK
jgi:hypothetical protein